MNFDPLEIKNKRQKAKIVHPGIITINLLLLLFLGNAFNLSFAQSQSDTTNTSATTPTSTAASTSTTSSSTSNQDTQAIKDLETKCLTEMNAFQAQEFEKYQTFIENHFKNKSGTTFLLNDAILRYEEYKKVLFTKLDEFENQNDKNAGANQQLQFRFLSTCRDQVKQAISDARSLLMMRAETTSYIKKSTAILDKYKQINAKLRDLNLEFLKMKVNLGTFSQKLPCYLRKSCNKG